jgi:hypothetical protein
MRGYHRHSGARTNMNIVQHAPMQRRDVFSSSLYGVYRVMGVCFEDTQTQHECMSTALAELGSGVHGWQNWKHWNSYKNATLCSNLRPPVSKSLDHLIYVFRLFSGQPAGQNTKSPSSTSRTCLHGLTIVLSFGGLLYIIMA